MRLKRKEIREKIEKIIEEQEHELNIAEEQLEDVIKILDIKRVIFWSVEQAKATSRIETLREVLYLLKSD